MSEQFPTAPALMNPMMRRFGIAGAVAGLVGLPAAVAIYASSAEAAPVTGIAPAAGQGSDPLEASVKCKDPTSDPDSIANIVITVNNTTSQDSHYTVGVDPGTYSNSFDLAAHTSTTFRDAGVANGDYSVILSGGGLVGYSKSVSANCPIETSSPTESDTPTVPTSPSTITTSPTETTTAPEGACTVTDHGQDNCPQPSAVTSSAESNNDNQDNNDNSNDSGNVAAPAPSHSFVLGGGNTSYNPTSETKLSTGDLVAATSGTAGVIGGLATAFIMAGRRRGWISIKPKHAAKSAA